MYGTEDDNNEFARVSSFDGETKGQHVSFGNVEKRTSALRSFANRFSRATWAYWATWPTGIPGASVVSTSFDAGAQSAARLPSSP